MKRGLIAITLLIASIAMAHAFGLGLGNRFGKFGAASGGGSISPLPTGSALLVDNTNPALLVDNTNPACLVGGC